MCVTFAASFATLVPASATATFIGTISGETMSGTWTSNASQSGTWVVAAIRRRLGSLPDFGQVELSALPPGNS